jgi:hypothetical protein
LEKTQNGEQVLTYGETVSKTYRGGLEHRNIEPHATKAYENKQNPERCHHWNKTSNLTKTADPTKKTTPPSFHVICSVGVNPFQITVLFAISDVDLLATTPIINL